jgi:hypothetical protein
VIGKNASRNPVGNGNLEDVAHAVTTSSDKPILLEADARARPVEWCLLDGWRYESKQALMDSTKDKEPSKCRRNMHIHEKASQRTRGGLKCWLEVGIFDEGRNLSQRRRSRTDKRSV